MHPLLEATPEHVEPTPPVSQDGDARLHEARHMLKRPWSTVWRLPAHPLGSNAPHAAWQPSCRRVHVPASTRLSQVPPSKQCAATAKHWSAHTAEHGL